MRRYKRYQAYKDSGVEWLGEIPVGWGVTRIGRMFEIKKRIVDELGHDVLSITQRGIKVRDTENNDGQLSMDYSKYQIVEVGDFAMNHMDLITGFIDIAQSPGVTSPDYRVFQLRDVLAADSRFFLAVFQDAYRRKLFFPFGQGSSQLGRWRLPTDAFKEYPILVPPTGQQTTIATFLDRETAKLDTLIAKQERLIALLQEKRQAIISHAVTKGLNQDVPMKDSGVEWLGEVPEHWEVRRVKFASLFTTSGPRGWSALVGVTGALFIQSGDLDDMMQVHFDEAKRVEVEDDAETSRTELHRGDVLVCITGAKTGNVALARLLPERAYINQHLCLIRPRNIIDSHFMALVLKSHIGSTYFDMAQYGLKQGLSLENVREAQLPLPSIEEQAMVVEFLDRETKKIDTLINKSRRSIELMREHRTALISAAVTGKIDVRGLA